jgi:hypothetical protein
MTKTGVFLLHLHPIKTFIHNLTTEQTETISGGSSGYKISMINSTDSTYINDVDNSIRTDGGGPGSINQHDNKYNTTDYSRSIQSHFMFM